MLRLEIRAISHSYIPKDAIATKPRKDCKNQV
jgi:hypothetical protein